MAPSGAPGQREPVAIETAAERAEALARALDRIDFDAQLTLALAATGKPAAARLVAIKANFMAAGKAQEAPAEYTDPALVEALARRLRAHGVGDVAVVESRIGPRPVADAAAALGYTSDSYRVVDLSDEMEPFDYGGVLGRAMAGRTWRDADVRISFAKTSLQPPDPPHWVRGQPIGRLPKPRARRLRRPGTRRRSVVARTLDAMLVWVGLSTRGSAARVKARCALARCSRAEACSCPTG